MCGLTQTQPTTTLIPIPKPKIGGDPRLGFPIPFPNGQPTTHIACWVGWTYVCKLGQPLYLGYMLLIT